MPAPYLDATISLPELRDEVVFSQLACALEPHAKDQADVFAGLLTEWTSVFQAQLAHWDAQTAADLTVTQIDRRIDSHVDDFDAALLVVVGGDRADAHYDLYLDVRPHELKRPTLGPELEAVRSWGPALATEEAVTLKPFAKVFAEDVTLADAAVEAQIAADKSNETFRAVGALAKYRAKVVAARDEVWATLEKRRATKPDWKLPKDFASSVFRRSQRASAAEQKARVEAKALAKKATAELAAKKKEAREKLKEAKRALAALK